MRKPIFFAIIIDIVDITLEKNEHQAYNVKCEFIYKNMLFDIDIFCLRGYL